MYRWLGPILCRGTKYECHEGPCYAETAQPHLNHVGRTCYNTLKLVPPDFARSWVLHLWVKVNEVAHELLY